ncbi:hypothetical protein MHU86_20100 [Fragilaria crotonensis]|nr:hypothetical protein MHU86_20100 [Fragilaria crotonensis]
MFMLVLSSLDKERLAFGMGPARGRRPHSYRAEAYGLLSFLQFLIRIREFSGMHEPWVGVVATDSQSVLDTLQLGDSDPQEEELPVDLDNGEVVLDCLRPDWDVLIEIQSALRNLPRERLQYVVEGHQDRKCPYQNLDLLGELNVDADKQANDFNLEHGAHRPIVLMSPLARAHLLLSDGTVTGKYSSVLLHEASTKPLLKYIRKKNNWSESTLQTINWEAHSTAIQRTSVPHTHLVMYLHRVLPTHAQANKFDGGHRKCVLCGSLNEDYYIHILRCEHNQRLEWRNKFLLKLRDFCIQSNTSPMLCAIMLDGLRRWFSASTELTIPPETYPSSAVRRVIAQQNNRIGWTQIFMGRFSKEWSTHQRPYLATLRGDGDLDSVISTWKANLIQLIWEQWYHLWKQRNGEVHGSDEKTRTDHAAKHEVQRQLEEIYSQRSMYETHVQELLHRELKDHDQHSLAVTRNWLLSNAPIFRESYRRVKRKSGYGNAVHPRVLNSVIGGSSRRESDGSYYTHQCSAYPYEPHVPTAGIVGVC